MCTLTQSDPFGFLRECSLFMGRGAGKWEGGGQAKFTPLFRGGQKGFALDLGKRGGGDKFEG